MLAGVVDAVTVRTAGNGIHARLDASKYDRLDRFGRVAADVWTADRATDMDLVRFTDIRYDSNSSITSVEDGVHGGYGHAYSMDALNRLIDSERGVVASGSIADDLWQETWGLSQTGNWLGHDLDLNGDGDLVDTDELDATNTFTKANEWADRDTNSATPAEYSLVYDETGNLTDDDRAYEYSYDAFGRLREVFETGTTDLVAEYRYNGLNQRIASHFDVDADGTVETAANGDPWWHFVYDARWRMVARGEIGGSAARPNGRARTRPGRGDGGGRATRPEQAFGLRVREGRRSGGVALLHPRL